MELAFEDPNEVWWEYQRRSNQGREYVVWEPCGDNSRWWIGPDDASAPHVPLDELERAIARS